MLHAELRSDTFTLFIHKSLQKKNIKHKIFSNMVQTKDNVYSITFDSYVSIGDLLTKLCISWKS